jgi:mannitol/fructose-specific phosphotransferase system IIA component (Ntr-type)
MLRHNGYEDMLLQLSDDEALRAGNQMTRLMQDLIARQTGSDGRAEMRALMECTTTLEELGVVKSFDEIVKATESMLPTAIAHAKLAGPTNA